MPPPVVIAQTVEALMLVGRQQREQGRDPLGPHARAVIVVPDMDIERTGRGMWALPDRREVRQDGQHVPHDRVDGGSRQADHATALGASTIWPSASTCAAPTCTA